MSIIKGSQNHIYFFHLSHSLFNSIMLFHIFGFCLVGWLSFGLHFCFVLFACLLVFNVLRHSYYVTQACLELLSS